jgi:tRNA(adenine34) deaminase
MNLKDYIWYMKIALEEAEQAYRVDEVPVGAVIIDSVGQVISKASNLKEKTSNPCGHAEILAIQEACSKTRDWRLSEHTLIVTLEPCPMCMSAAIQSRLQKVIFGAYDPKGGSISIGINVHNNERLNHKMTIIGGLEHYRCSKLLSEFFTQKRNLHKSR